MTELEHRLAALAAEVAWPETPPLAVPEVVRSRPMRRAPWLRVAAVGLAVLLLAAGVAALIPGARSTILEWFRIGGVTVERVESVPSDVASFDAYLGRPVSQAAAEALLGGPLLAPAVDPRPALYVRDGIVAAVLETATGAVLLERFASAELPLALKRLAAQTTFDFVEVVPGHTGAWLAGEPHVVFARKAPPRLAGNALVWEHAGITYRLEGRRLDRKQALAIAREVMPR